MSSNAFANGNYDIIQFRKKNPLTITILRAELSFTLIWDMGNKIGKHNGNGLYLYFRSTRLELKFFLASLLNKAMQKLFN